MISLEDLKIILRVTDLQGLIKNGQPADEYDELAARVYERLLKGMTAYEIEAIMYDEFAKDFNYGTPFNKVSGTYFIGDLAGPEDRYEFTARLIHKRLND